MLWIGTYAGVWGYNGIGVLLKEADTITHFPKEQGKLTPTPQAVFAIAEDKDGNIWFGDRDTGAWKYDGTQLTSPMILCIYKDQQDHLLFGMAAGKKG